MKLSNILFLFSWVNFRSVRPGTSKVHSSTLAPEEKYSWSVRSAETLRHMSSALIREEERNEGFTCMSFSFCGNWDIFGIETFVTCHYQYINIKKCTKFSFWRSRRRSTWTRVQSRLAHTPIVQIQLFFYWPVETDLWMSMRHVFRAWSAGKYF